MDLTLSRHSQARLDFIEGLKVFVGGRIVPNLRQRFDDWAAHRGHDEATLRERKVVAERFEHDPVYQSSRGLQRISQEAMWRETFLALDERRAEIEATLEADAAKAERGALALDPDLEPPAYYAKNEFHLQPGSYHGSPLAGPVYELGVATYTMHRYGKASDEMGRALLQAMPARRFRRTLYLGCGPAYKGYPVADSHPEAVHHGVDLSAPMLKFAHHRAETHGRPIHFHQMNAERTSFPDGHFDFVYCMLLLHEVPRRAVENIVAEAHRLLVPGGVFANLELPAYEAIDPLSAYLMDWDTHHNGEPYWRGYHELDLRAVYERAGFTVETIAAHSEWGGAKGNYMGRFAYDVTLGTKPEASR